LGELFAPWHLLILLIVFGFFSLPVIFYILTLQKALRKCAPQSRTLEPGLVWLYLIPVVNLVIGFIIVLGMARTLRNEFNRRGTPVPDREPGQAIGLTMAICACCSIVPLLGVFAVIAYVVLWIVYWVKIAEFSRMLDLQFQSPPTSNPSIY
jgi:cobalamin synthase